MSRKKMNEKVSNALFVRVFSAISQLGMMKKILSRKLSNVV